MQETGPLLPFAETISSLHEARRRMETMEPRAAAATLESLTDQIDRLRRAVEAGLKSDSTQGSVKTTRIVALRASEDAAVLRQTLQQWYRYYNGYDPMFTWWADAALQECRRGARRLRGLPARAHRRGRPGEDEPIVGDPIGRDALLADLAHEMIPYTPEELIAIARERVRVVRGGDEEGVARDGIRRRLESRAGEGEEHARRARQAARSDPRPRARGDRLRREARLVTVPPLAKDDLADGDDVAGAAARDPVLPRRRSHPGVLSDRRR